MPIHPKKTKHVWLMVVLEKTSEDHQRQQALPSLNHNCLYKISCQSIQQFLRYFGLGQSCGLAGLLPCCQRGQKHETAWTWLSSRSDIPWLTSSTHYLKLWPLWYLTVIVKITQAIARVMDELPNYLQRHKGKNQTSDIFSWWAWPTTGMSDSAESVFFLIHWREIHR